MSPAPEVLRAKWNLNGNPIILYYGTFEPYQGLDLLLKSIKLLQNEDSICILVGGNTEQIHYYRRKAKDLGIADKVIFTGPVQPWEIDGYIKISSVLVSPRLEGNNTPLKVYKAADAISSEVSPRLYNSIKYFLTSSADNLFSKISSNFNLA